jgi:rhodanese-related sulfurtransferase
MKFFWQMVVIVFISVITALCFNQFRSNRLPWVYAWSENLSRPVFSEFVSTVSIKEAADLYKNNHAIFLDSRPESIYKNGHIKGALNLPWDEVEEKCDDIMSNIETDEIIITYCDGPACDLCNKLAVFLCDMGFENVNVLINGWILWNQNKLPVDYSAKTRS